MALVKLLTRGVNNAPYSFWTGASAAEIAPATTNPDLGDRAWRSDTGLEYVYTGAGTWTATDVTAATVVLRKFKTGYYYTVPTHANDGATTGSLPLNRCFWVPFPAGQIKTFDQIGAETVNQIASSSVRLGIYTDLDGAPDALVLDAGTIDSTLAVGTKTISISQQLGIGLYWLAYVCQGTTGVALRARGIVNGIVPLGTAFTNGNEYAWYKDGVSGALPATATGIDTINSGGSAGKIVLRAA